MKTIVKTLLFSLVVSALWGQQPELELVGRWHNEEIRASKGQRYNDIWGWTSKDGREYAIMGSIDSTYFIEVTFPDKPVLRDVIAGRDTSCYHRDYKVYKNYCYAVADEGRSSLQIFDLSYLPDSVSLVYDDDELTRRSHNIFIADDKAFLLSDLHPRFGFLPMAVLDLSKDPINPKAVNFLTPLKVDEEELFNHVHDAYVRDGIAYCSNGDGGLYVYDVSDGLELLGSLTTYTDQGYNHSSWLTDSGDYLVMADETHGLPLKMLDVRDLSSIEVVSTFGSNNEVGSIPHNPFVIGDLCFVSYYHEGLLVYDISDPENVVEVDRYDTYPTNNDTTYEGYDGCWGVYPYFPSGTVVASDMVTGLYVFNVKNWVSPLAVEQPKPQVFSLRLNEQTVEIDFDSAYSDQILLSVFNTSGQMLYQAKEKFTGYHYTTTLPVLAEGIYFVQINTSIGSEVLKTLKLSND